MDSNGHSGADPRAPVVDLPWADKARPASPTTVDLRQLEVSLFPDAGRAEGPDDEPGDPGCLAAEAEAAASRLEAVARDHHWLDFYLGPLAWNERARAILREIAHRRARSLWSWRLSCELEEVVSSRDADLLRAAGVREARLAPVRPSRDPAVVKDPFRLNLEQLRAVIFLHEVEVQVDCNLWCPLYASAEVEEELAGVVRKLHHLPPPRGLGLICSAGEAAGAKQNSANGGLPPQPGPDQKADGAAELPGHRVLLEALAEWGRQPDLNKLVYEMGPGFVSVSDRRSTQSATVTRINLEGLQATLFLRARQGCPLDELSRLAPTVSREKLVSFLGKLVERGVMFRAPGGWYQSLPLRARWIVGPPGQSDDDS